MTKVDGARVFVIADPDLSQLPAFIGQDDFVLYFCFSFVSSSAKQLHLRDLYSLNTFRKRSSKFELDFESLLQNGDRLFEKFTGTYAVSDNGFWLLHRLSHLRFINEIAASLEELTNDVTLLLPSAFEEVAITDISIRDARLMSLSGGLSFSISCLAHSLPKATRIKSQPIGGTKKNAGEIRSKLLRFYEDISHGSLDLFFQSILLKLKSKFVSKKFEDPEDCVLIGERGYDVEILRASASEIPFRDLPYEEFFDCKRSNINVPAKTINTLEEGVSEFLDVHLDRFKDILVQPISGYLVGSCSDRRRIISRLEQFLVEVRPRSLLFSGGATDFEQRTLCRAANNIGIPIVYLRHQGFELSYLKPWLLDKYFERDVTIPRMQTLFNNLEKEIVSLPSFVRVWVNPSLRFISPLKERPIKKGRLLYSMGPSACLSFKQPPQLISDLSRYQFVSSLIMAAEHNQLGLDIKIFPAEPEILEKTISHIAGSENKHVNVLKYGDISRFLAFYQYIVLDVVASSVLSFAMAAGLEIILFLPRDSDLEASEYNRLNERVHFVEHYQQINSVLSSIVDGTIEPKRFNEEFRLAHFGQFSYHEAVARAHSMILNPHQ